MIPFLAPDAHRPGPLLGPDAHREGPCVIDARTGVRLAGRQLTRAIGAAAARIDQAPPGAVLCLTGADLASVLRYLGVLATGRPAILWDPGAPPQVVDDLIDRFTPAAVLGLDATPTSHAAPAPARRAPTCRAAPAGYRVVESTGFGPAWVRRTPPEVLPHDQLSVLLGTSGSTGRPRLVRQSAAAVQASASAIGAALRIDAGDVAVTSLPLFYTFGLSVLHSHLLAGATVVVDGRGLLDRGFWDSVDRYAVTAIAGVPHSFELLARKPWRPALNPSVRTLTLSGGRLRDDLVTHFHTAMGGHGGHLFVMYGQTEAGSRICVLPPARLPGKLGSVGPPVPGMRLTIDRDVTAGTTRDSADGEVVCHSATVMMGYAEDARDLARGDDHHGTLRTGDLGRLDDDGYLWLSGRANRIGKAYGVRVNLDAVEHVVAAVGVAAALPGDDRITIWCEGVEKQRLPDVATLVARELGIHRTAVRVDAVERLPRRPNGKIDYHSLPS